MRIATNDPKRPETTLIVQASVTTAITVDPDRVHFRGYAGDPLVTRVRISAAPGLSLAITAVRARSGKDIRLDIDPLGNGSTGGYRLTVTSIRKAAGRIDDTITIFTDNPAKPQFTIPVTGRILKR